MKAVALLVALLLCTSCAIFAPDRFGYKYRDGAHEATEDLASGVKKIKICGLWEESFAREYFGEARNQFGIEFDAIGLCVVDNFLLRYADSYNAVVERHLKKTYGRDVLRELSDSIHARQLEEKRANSPQPLLFTRAR